MKRKRVAFLSSLLLVFVVSPLLASTVLRMSNEDLAKRAEVIFHGKCVGHEAQASGPTVITTSYTFDVTRGIKGGAATGKRFTFKALGGQLEGRGYAISGSPTYAQDEEVLVFLDAEHEKTGCRHAIGLSQGKFTVKVEADSKKKYLVRDLGGLSLVGKDGKPALEKESEKRLYLDDFVKEIESYLGGGGDEGRPTQREGGK